MDFSTNRVTPMCYNTFTNESDGYIPPLLL